MIEISAAQFRIINVFLARMREAVTEGLSIASLPVVPGVASKTDLERADENPDTKRASDNGSRLHLAAVLAAMVSEPWTLVRADEYQNGWAPGSSPYEPFQYRLNALGRVEFKGGAGIGATGVVFQLPPGYRPSSARVFSLPVGNLVQVNPTGTVEVVGTPGGNLFLDGMSFDVP